MFNEEDKRSSVNNVVNILKTKSYLFSVIL